MCGKAVYILWFLIQQWIWLNFHPHSPLGFNILWYKVYITKSWFVSVIDIGAHNTLLRKKDAMLSDQWDHIHISSWWWSAIIQCTVYWYPMQCLLLSNEAHLYPTSILDSWSIFHYAKHVSINNWSIVNTIFMNCTHDQFAVIHVALIFIKQLISYIYPQCNFNTSHKAKYQKISNQNSALISLSQEQSCWATIP